MDVERPVRSASQQQRAHDRIHLNVGGERFTTTRSTLELSTSYFASTFADEWADTSGDTEIFLDLDADCFRVLLSCMRSRKVLLPRHDEHLCQRALLAAEFLGFDFLLDEVKRGAYEFLAQGPYSQLVPACGQPAAAALHAFEERHGGLRGMIDKGLLPACFFGQAPSRTPTYPRISRFVAAGPDAEVVFLRGDDEHAVRPIAFYADVEHRDGSTSIEPVVARQWRSWQNGPRVARATRTEELYSLSYEVDDWAELETTKPDKKLMFASEWAADATLSADDPVRWAVRPHGQAWSGMRER